MFECITTRICFEKETIDSMSMLANAEKINAPIKPKHRMGVLKGHHIVITLL